MEFDEATTVPHERSKKKSPSKSNGEIKLEADDEFMNDLRNLYNKVSSSFLFHFSKELKKMSKSINFASRSLQISTKRKCLNVNI